MTKTEEPLEIEDTSIILGDEGTSCKSLENITKTNSIWMSSSADWSTLQLHLGKVIYTENGEPCVTFRSSSSYFYGYRNFHKLK